MPTAADLNIETLLQLLLIVFAVALVAQRLRIPYTVALVVAGIIVALIPGIGNVQLTPDLILKVLLPILLFEGSYNVPIRRLRRDIAPVLLLAIPGVLLGTIVTGAIVHYALDLRWSVSLLFGALLAATDPVAVLAMFRELGAPKRLSILVEGESLLNDGTAFTLFQVLLVAVVAPAEFSVGHGIVQFVTTVLGALVIGGIIGYAGSLLLRAVDSFQVEITATVLAAYGAYLIADHFEFSGVIATVIVGLFFGNYGSTTSVSPGTVRALSSTWEFLGFVANSLIFLFIGIQLDPRRFFGVWWFIVIAFIAIQVGRAVVVWLLTPLVRGELKIPWRYRPAMFWGGLRGALSLALILSLPYQINSGASFPDRDLLQLVTFGVVGLSLLLQGLTMTPLIKVLGLAESRGLDREAEIESVRGRLIANEAATIHLGKQRERHEISELEYERFSRSYERQHQRLMRRLNELQQAEVADSESREEQDTERDRAQVEKEALHELYERGDISGNTYNALEEEIEERVRREGEVAEAEDR